MWRVEIEYYEFWESPSEQVLPICPLEVPADRNAFLITVRENQKRRRRPTVVDDDDNGFTPRYK